MRSGNAGAPIHPTGSRTASELDQLGNGAEAFCSRRIEETNYLEEPSRICVGGVSRRCVQIQHEVLQSST
jgi:hypothetical protein